MQRLIKVVQTSPDDKAAKKNLLPLSFFISCALHEVQGIRKGCREKEEDFPAPEPQWSIISGLTFENKALIDISLDTSQLLPLLVFTRAGAATFTSICLLLMISKSAFSPVQETCLVPAMMVCDECRINWLMSRLQKFHARFQALKNLIQGF